MNTKKTFQLGGSERKRYESVKLVVSFLKEQDVVTASGGEVLVENGGEWIFTWN